MLAGAFRGHGTFIFEAEETLRKFGNSATRVVDALRRAGMSHAWVRLHDYSLKEEPEQPTRAIIGILKDANVAVAGWGFDSGHHPAEDARSVAAMVKKYGLTHYVADIEQDEHHSQWTPRKIADFLTELRTKLPQGAQIFVSSYPYIVGKHPDLMHAAAPIVDGFAPQIYWQNYPNARMLEHQSLPPHPSRPYVTSDLHSPAVYADLCLDWWNEIVGTKPLILTGQAYWEHGFERSAAEGKLLHFLEAFTGWRRLCAVNWWHLGGPKNTESKGAMTAAMFDAIAEARIQDKPFAAPQVA